MHKVIVTGIQALFCGLVCFELMVESIIFAKIANRFVNQSNGLSMWYFISF